MDWEAARVSCGGIEVEAAEKYAEALRACPWAGGGVHAWMLGTANLAFRADVPEAKAIAEITAAASRPPHPAREVRDAVEKAYRLQAAHGLALPPKPITPKPTRKPLVFEELVRCGDGADESFFWDESPVRIDWGDEWWRDAVALLHALFLPSELVYCGDLFGKVVRERDEWCLRWKAGEPVPPFLCVNPLKADGGMTAEGKPSSRCDDAVAVFRHAVAEIDERTLAEQMAFWAAMGLDGVTSITFSGGKSLHVVLRVDCRDRDEWDRSVRDGLFLRYLVPLGCDGACKNPARLSRLAGAMREDKGGAVQKLLFVREELS